MCETHVRFGEDVVDHLHPSDRAYLSAGVILTLMAAIIFVTVSIVFKLAAEQGQLGDFIGGVLGTIASLLSVILLIVTLRAQQQQFDRQNFESHFFELVKLHRQNIDEMEVKDGSGRRIFYLLLLELEVVLQYADRLNVHNRLDERDVLRAAFLCFYFGVGPRSKAMLETLCRRHYDADHPELSEVLLGLERQIFIDRKQIEGSLIDVDETFFRNPVDGHQSRLSHYFRNFFHAIEYIDHSSSPWPVKQQYADILRAQLSIQEQTLILLSRLSPMYEAPSYFVDKFELTKNIPDNFFNDKLTMYIDSLRGDTAL